MASIVVTGNVRTSTSRVQRINRRGHNAALKRTDSSSYNYNYENNKNNKKNDDDDSLVTGPLLFARDTDRVAPM
jgi:hypothetical protein